MDHLNSLGKLLQRKLMSWEFRAMQTFRSKSDMNPRIKRFNEWVDSWRGIFMLLFLGWMASMLYFTAWYADSSFTRSQAFIGAEESCSRNISINGFITSAHTITYCYNLSEQNEQAWQQGFLKMSGRCIDAMWLEFANRSCNCNGS